MGVRAVGEHVDWGPGDGVTCCDGVRHLRLAWQLTSPWTAGVLGGMESWERSSRNMPAVYLGASRLTAMARPLWSSTCGLA